MNVVRLIRSVVAVCLAVSVAVAGPADAASPPTGPRLPVGSSQLAKALQCTGAIEAGSRPPILLIHGTTSSVEANWSWNWVRALDARRWPHCELSLPDSGNADIQTAGEYVAAAIPAMSRRAGGQRIDVVGHSQGGMVVRWALKYWPDTRSKVDDVVGLASSNYGTQVFNTLCLTSFCSAANWQQRRGSAFLTALNRGADAWPGISYTQVATRYDEVVVPFDSTFLRDEPSSSVVNTTVQDVCPTEVVEHFGMAYSIGAWLIALDALTHRGPARVSRVPRSACGEIVMPGVDRPTFAVNVATALSQTAVSSLTTPQLVREPDLRAYAR